MKLPIPTLLYLTSAGLFGYAGWTVYEMLPMLEDKTYQQATQKGQKDGVEHLTKGKGTGPVSVDWQYSAGAWWEEFKAPNYLGTPPAPTVDPTVVQPPPPPPVAQTKPLDQIIELVSLVYDGSTQGKGGNSHVIVRYRQEAGVQPPQWYLLENALDAGAAALASTRGDVVPSRQGPTRGGQNNQRPPSSMPTSMVGRDILQTMWVAGGDDERRGNRLWGEYSSIRLVRVSSDAQVAYFVRDVPPAKEGEPAVEPKEEDLIKTSAALDQELLRELRRLQGRAPTSATPGRDLTAPDQGVWIESEATTQKDNRWNIGREDERRFQNVDDLLTKFSVDTYRSKHSDMTGVIVRNVDPKLASTFGVQQQDVLIEVNNRQVQTQAQTVQFVKGEYNKGVRTFVTKWMTNGGQIVERVYQAPTK